MARVIYGSLVTEIKGSIGGTTFQSNRYGHTIKNKPNVTKPRTKLQNRQKIYFAAPMNIWRSLSQVQRDAWNAWAASHPQYAKNNPGAVLSGQAVFAKVHAQKFLRSSDIADFTPSPTAALESIDDVVFSLTNEAPVLTLAFTWANSLGNTWANVFMSQPFPASLNFVGTRTRYVATTETLTGNANIATEYSALYGNLPQVGDKIFVENVQYVEGNGQVFARQKQVVTVLAP